MKGFYLWLQRNYFF